MNSLNGIYWILTILQYYCSKNISIEGKTDIAFTENRLQRFEAYGWHVQQVEDGNDLIAIEDALTAA